MKIGFIASSGGHWEELIRLMDVGEGCDHFYVTEEGAQATEWRGTPKYCWKKMNRHEKWFFWHFISLCLFANKILKAEAPDVIITTGALVAFPFCAIAKMRGIKVVFIESFARINEKSLTGRLVYPFADVFCVQWESMLKHYPHAIYIGGVF